MARSNSLQLKIYLLKKALIFSAFFYVAIFDAAAANVCPPHHIDETARVNYVYDGDTLQLEDGRKVRLMGIDTPEVYAKRGRIATEIRRSGEQAKIALKALLAESSQQIGLAYGVQRFDRYQRTLAHVFLADGKNIQAALISGGYAIAFTTPPDDSMSDCYRQQEALAIKAKRGIWQLAQYKLKRSVQLNSASDGFHRLQGRVTRLWQSANQVRFLLDDTVEVKIRGYDLANFNNHMLKTLENKKIQIRGWLHVKKVSHNASQQQSDRSRFIMSLRHADAIKVLN